MIGCGDAVLIVQQVNPGLFLQDLVDDLAQVLAYDAGLLAQRAKHHPGTGDKGGCPSGAQGPGNVPVVGRDEQEVTRRDAKLMGCHAVISSAAAPMAPKST